MSWSINIVCSDRRLIRRGIGILLGIALAATAFAQDTNLRAPEAPVAGNPALIGTDGSGSATLYLVGPSSAVKHDIELGKSISLSAKELQSAGRYIAIVCSTSCNSVTFFVAPAKAANVTFLVHPSRAPVAQNDAVSGVALAFDEFHNLVLTPIAVQFELTAKGSSPMSRNAETRDGIAWFRSSSSRSAGPLQVTASVSGDISARRIVQQVASDPCNLRIKGEKTAKGIVVETEPVRDCSGNPVPDGTVVTFTAKTGNQTSSVDAPVKQDVARATILAKGPVVISAASGVAMGNEVHIGGGD
jgi:hypothetical protein